MQKVNNNWQNTITSIKKDEDENWGARITHKVGHSSNISTSVNPPVRYLGTLWEINDRGTSCARGP
jgi:hypothetical protein